MAKRPPAHDSRAEELAAREAAVLEADQKPEQDAHSLVGLFSAEAVTNRRPAPVCELKEQAEANGRPAAVCEVDPDALSAEDIAYLHQRWAIAGDVTPEELLGRAVEDTQTAMYRVFRAGAHFLLLKKALPHGQFLSVVAESGVAPERAREAMRLERARLRMPAEQRERFLELGKKKALMIAALDSETADAILGGDGFEDWMGLPKRALADRIRKLEKQNADLTADKEIAEANLAKISKEGGTSKLTKLDLWRRRQKLSAHGLSELAQRTALEVGRLVEEISEPQWQPRGEDDALADKALCTAVRLELRAAKAAWDEAYALCLTRLEARMSTRDDDVPVMTRAEIDDARRQRATMAELSKKELDHLTALHYARDALDDATERGATPKAFRKLRKPA